jgi:hypothetical protein
MNLRYFEIVGIVSFNYDLVLETMLKKLSLDYHRVGSSEERSSKGIPIFKPHGSCDFDINGSIEIENNMFKNITYLNDAGPVSIVAENKLLEPRNEADIVLPFEFSPQLGLRWINHGFALIIDKAKGANRVLVIGLSYMQCDRKEIDLILDNLKRDLLIQYVTPNENTELRKKLKTISKNVERIDPNQIEDFKKI